MLTDEVFYHSPITVVNEFDAEEPMIMNYAERLKWVIGKPVIVNWIRWNETLDKAFEETVIMVIGAFPVIVWQNKLK